MHAEAFAFVARAASQLQARGPVYEIGSRNINGTVRGLFHGVEIYIGIDVAPGDGVDLMADGATYAPPFVPQTIVCCEVLEHSPKAGVIVEQAIRVLRPGGLLILTMAGEGRDEHSAYDGGPLRADEWYQNVSVGDLEHWVSEIQTLLMETRGGDLYFAGRKP